METAYSLGTWARTGEAQRTSWVRLRDGQKPKIADLDRSRSPIRRLTPPDNSSRAVSWSTTMVSVCLRRHGYGTECLVIVGAEIILARQLDVRFGSSWQPYILLRFLGLHNLKKGLYFNVYKRYSISYLTY